MPKAALSKILKVCIVEAYRPLKKEILSGIAVYSIRTSTNMALISQASVEEICKGATWSSLFTFVKHYKLNLCGLVDSTFSRRVLHYIFWVKTIIHPALTLLWKAPKMSSASETMGLWILTVQGSFSLRKGGHLALPTGSLFLALLSELIPYFP